MTTRTFLFLLVAAFNGTLPMTAQPTLTAALNAPIPGETYVQHQGAYIAPGNGGADRIWDFSMLEADSTAQVSLVAPTATPHGSLFPQSTVAQLWSNSTTYYTTATDGVYYAGSDADVQITYSDPGLFLAFPCTYQTTWNDSEAASYSTSGMSVTRTGTITGTADGYGQLILPNGTYTNVLRIHWHEVVEDVASFTSTTGTHSYLYYVAGTHHPLLQLVSSTMSFGGSTHTTQFARWSEQITTGAADVIAPGPDVLLYPNPATDRVQLRAPGLRGAWFIRVLDHAGRAVRTERITASSEAGTSMDVSSLAVGLYSVLITDDDGRTASTTLIRR